MVAVGTVRAVNTRFEIDVVASVEVPTTTSAPFEVRLEVAVNAPARDVPSKVVDAREEVVVEVREPIVAKPAVSDAAVAEVVAEIVPPVTDPEVIAADVTDVVAVSDPAVSIPIVAFASVAVEVEVSDPDVREPIVALGALRD